jgi:hypothetical protein
VLQVSAHGFNDTIDKKDAANSWKQQMDAKTGIFWILLKKIPSS